MRFDKHGRLTLVCRACGLEKIFDRVANVEEAKERLEGWWIIKDFKKKPYTKFQCPDHPDPKSNKVDVLIYLLVERKIQVPALTQ